MIFSSNWHVVSEIPKVTLFDVNSVMSFSFSDIKFDEQTLGKQRPKLIAIPPCVLWMMLIKIHVLQSVVISKGSFTVASAYVSLQNYAHHLSSTYPKTIRLVHCVRIAICQNSSVWFRDFPCNIVLDRVVHFVLNESIGWRHQIHKSFPKKCPKVIFPKNPQLIQRKENN